MLRYETGDLVTGNYPVFCHQVNCKGVMGSGIAKQIRNRYPEVYTMYKEMDNYLSCKLGIAQYVNTSDDRICVNMFTQDGYGRDKRYTEYNAFKACLNSIALASENWDVDTIAFPYGIGCGLAGGDWYIVLGMLKDFSEKVRQDVVIVSLK